MPCIKKVRAQLAPGKPEVSQKEERERNNGPLSHLLVPFHLTETYPSPPAPVHWNYRAYSPVLTKLTFDKMDK